MVGVDDRGDCEVSLLQKYTSSGKIATVKSMSISDAWSDQANKQAIQDAVLAERERCAKIAEANGTGDGWCQRCGNDIAAAIRSGK